MTDKIRAILTGIVERLLGKPRIFGSVMLLLMFMALCSIVRMWLICFQCWAQSVNILVPAFLALLSLGSTIGFVITTRRVVNLVNWNTVLSQKQQWGLFWGAMQTVFGDMQEEREYIEANHGAAPAASWYRKQWLLSVVPRVFQAGFNAVRTSHRAK